MNTTIPKKPEAAASKSSKTKDANQDASQSAEALQQFMKSLQPLLDFQQAAEAMIGDDVNLLWDVKLVRGRDEPFVNVHGCSTFNSMLAPNMRIAATSVIQQEITEKIVRPLVMKLHEEVERMFSADLAARKDEVEAEEDEDDEDDEDDDEDEDPCSDNPPMP